MSINNVLPSCVPQDFCRKAILATMAVLLWTLMAVGIQTYPAYGATLLPVELQKKESRLLSAGGPNAATDLKAETRCDPERRTGFGRLRWNPASLSGNQQREHLRPGARTLAQRPTAESPARRIRGSCGRHSTGGGRR